LPLKRRRKPGHATAPAQIRPAKFAARLSQRSIHFRPERPRDAGGLSNSVSGQDKFQTYAFANKMVVASWRVLASPQTARSTSALAEARLASEAGTGASYTISIKVIRTTALASQLGRFFVRKGLMRFKACDSRTDDSMTGRFRWRSVDCWRLPSTSVSTRRRGSPCCASPERTTRVRCPPSVIGWPTCAGVRQMGREPRLARPKPDTAAPRKPGCLLAAELQARFTGCASSGGESVKSRPSGPRYPGAARPQLSPSPQPGHMPELRA
jgi:hypothetical protein